MFLVFNLYMEKLTMQNLTTNRGVLFFESFLPELNSNFIQ